MKAKKPRSAFTQEYKIEAIRLYDSGLGLAAAALTNKNYHQLIFFKGKAKNKNRSEKYWLVITSTYQHQLPI